MDSIIGTGVALVTPFKTDLSIDFDALKTIVEFHINSGIDYLVIHGTTGETPTTSFSEKVEILEFIKKINQGRLPIVIGAGGNSTHEILEFIEKVDFDGIDAILTVAPYYNKPSQEGLIRHFSIIADKAPVPIILYNVPGRTGVNIKPSTVLTLSKHPNIVAIKEASGKVGQVIEILASCSSNFMVISGDDLITLPIIACGGKGVISVLANAYPAEFSSMVREGLNGNYTEANKMLHNFVELNSLMYKEGSPVGIKSLLSQLGYCENVVRLPLAEASEYLQKEIASAVAILKVTISA